MLSASRANGEARPPAARVVPWEAWLVGSLAFAVRALVLVWARNRFPPADDGTFYHVVASRIAAGAGYTWLWPDGAVSYAAHYPVGYPALLGLTYAVFGARPVVAMALNVALGTLAASVGQRAVRLCGSRRQALAAGLLLALHPGLVFYTPALMTEGIAAELLVVAVWLALRVGSKRGWPYRLTLLGLCAGYLTLVRPQLLVMAPLLGWFTLEAAKPRYLSRSMRALAVTALALTVCLPWTLRNCARMDRCVFVSANGGWNLLIGALPEADGAWAPIEGERVPTECRRVFGEAEKDRCFGHSGVERIRRDPLSFVRLIPRKLSLTFDYFGAPGHYLHASNWLAFDEARKWRLGVAETVWERSVLLLAILQAARVQKSGRGLRLVAALPAACCALMRFGYLGYLGYVLTVALSGKHLSKSPLQALTAALILTTAATHSLFFGAGRYGFVCAALLCLAAVGSRDGSRIATPSAPAESVPAR